MRIAIISPFNPKEIADLLDSSDTVKPTESIATSVNNIVRGFVALGHDVTVITSSSGSNERILEYKGENLRVYVIQNRYKLGLFGLRTYQKIHRLIREHINEFDVLHAHWTSEYAFSLIPFVSQIPCFCSVRDWAPYLMRIRRTFKSKIRMRIRYYFFKKVMKTKGITKVANSLYISRRMSNYLHHNDVPLIPNSVNSRLIVDSCKIKNEGPVFISVGQSLNDKRKNYSTLLKAFVRLRKDYPNAVLKLIGDGDEKLFKSLSEEHDFFLNIEFLGKLSHSQVIEQIDKSSVHVHPAFEETFGNVFLEAAARNIPSIGGYDAGAVAQVLDYGRAGCLCDISDVESLYMAMKLLIEDTSYREYITRNAHKRVSQIYSDTVVCQEHIKLYKSRIMCNDKF